MDRGLGQRHLVLVVRAFLGLFRALVNTLPPALGLRNLVWVINSPVETGRCFRALLGVRLGGVTTSVWMATLLGRVSNFVRLDDQSLW